MCFQALLDESEIEKRPGRFFFLVLLVEAENRCGETSPGCECERGCEASAAAGNQFEFHGSGAPLDAWT